MRPSGTRYADRGSVRIAYEDHGGAGGDPLMLIMGLGTSRAWWPTGFIDQLMAQGFHVVTVDNRDAGESTRFSDGPRAHPLVSLLGRRVPAYTVEDMTDDLVAVLDAVGWDQAHLFGHSMGGLLSQATAVRHRTRILSIASSSAVPLGAGPLQLLRYMKPGVMLKLSRMKFPAGSDGDQAAGVALARMLASPGFPFDVEEVRDRIQRDVSSGVRDTAAQSRQTGATWSGGSCAHVRVPTLVLHGADDPLIRPSAARYIAASVPGSRLVMLPGVGHDLPRAMWPGVAADVRTNADRRSRPARDHER